MKRDEVKIALAPLTLQTFPSPFSRVGYLSLHVRTCTPRFCISGFVSPAGVLFQLTSIRQFSLTL